MAEEDRSAPRTFGVEEEYLLLHAADGTPADRAAQLVRDLAEHGEDADREFFASQLETATPVCRTAAEAEAALTGFRARLAREAEHRGVVLAGTGLPPAGGEEAGTVTPQQRYRLIGEELGEAAAHQYVTGTHVHVAVPSSDAGVEVLARLARWAPALVALTANSPVWCGAETGFAAWRQIMNRSWPVSGYPPEFADGAAYERAIAQLVESGILIDSGIVTWEARLSQRFPTVELRIADAQLEAGEAVSFAVLVRALVEHALRDAAAGRARPEIAAGLVDGAVWKAARNGLDGELVDPLTARSLPAFDLVDLMIAEAQAELTEFGDFPRIERYVGRLRREGGPARRQLARFRERGMAGLLELYREGMGIGAPTAARAAARA
ncbi:glutamate--cysteine ligase [Leucobacter allii]|uniref:Putative glutamate--cysteine ligase 2 n=1 Tax=Leucobacter allii TaxID=2932247 RepID=A0ABY4FJM6_9MICO|nr:glutamate--cysteine ligase [Leucobacter allii]UOQ56189.1 glutamate--cysteine ligase [Leucobacter allii]